MKKILFLSFLTLVTLCFNSCKSDDDSESVTIYSVGFSSINYSGSSLDGLTTLMSEIQGAYMTALKNAGGTKVDDASYKFTGSNSDCDSKAKSACSSAESSLGSSSYGLTVSVTYVRGDGKSGTLYTHDY